MMMGAERNYLDKIHYILLIYPGGKSLYLQENLPVSQPPGFANFLFRHLISVWTLDDARNHTKAPVLILRVGGATFYLLNHQSEGISTRD